MKHISFVFFLILTIAVPTFAQVNTPTWQDLMLDNSPTKTLQEVKDAFYAEWEGKPYVKGKGWKQFHRWENFWESRLNPDGTFASYTDIYKEFQTFKQQEALNQNKSLTGNWIPMGPDNMTNTASWSAGQGRINIVLEDPTNANTIYVGAPAGGLWKSTNGGASWNPLTDHFSAIGISGIAVDYNNANIIYVSTGDADAGNTYSIGVWKSTDGGASWNPTGNLSGATNRILIDPSNTNTLYVGSTAGLWKSTNGGTSWSNILNLDINDIKFKPGTSSTIYAVSPQAFHYSTNSGASFTTAAGIPASTGKIVIGTTPANSDLVYILTANSSNAFQGLYRSLNSGQSFSPRNTTDDVFDGSSQAWYDIAITVSTTDENLIFTGILDIWQSTNGGINFNQFNSWSSPSDNNYTHGDIHYLGYFGNNFYCGSDGGVSKSTDDGQNFTDLSPGLQIGQFYTIASSENAPTVIAGGLQDNGGYVFSNNNWNVYYGADGMESAIDPNNANKIYGMIQYGSLYYSNDGGLSSSSGGSPESGAWVTPMQHDPNNNRLVAGYSELFEYDIASDSWNQLSNFSFGNDLRHVEIYESNSDVIFVSTSSDIYKTTNNGNSFTNITNNMGSVMNSSFTITSIEVNPANNNEIWVSIAGASAGNKIAHSTDGGQTWTNISGNLPNIPTHIVKYVPGSNGDIYIGTDVGVYYTNTSMNNNWISFMSNLPNAIVNDLEIISTNNIIRAGTYGRGVWQSDLFSNTTISNDAGLSGLSEPIGSSCTSSLTPTFNLTNWGQNTLNNVDIKYQLDGGPTATYNWTGALASYNYETVNLPSINITTGNHTLIIYAENPNAQADPNISNDTIISSFYISPDSPVTVSITLDCYGTETTWVVLDNAGSVLFSGGPYSNGSGGVVIDENICLPVNNCFEFYIYDSYGDGLNGSSYSSCGIDGNYEITDSIGNILATMTTADGAFGNEEQNNFCLGDTSQNNIGIAQIGITQLSIFPNPTTNLVNINFNSKVASNFTMSLQNLNGEILWTTNQNTISGTNNIKIDLKSYASGIYLLELKNDEGLIVKKLIKK